MPLTVGSRLGPYEILAPLGAGGMGEVYRAKDPRLKREVAIKVLPSSFSEDADRLRRFEQEAQAAGALNHPNITAVYDIGSHDGAPYVVQELLEGESLRAALAGGKLPPRRAIDHAIQIAQGLAAAHDKGIVHRDLKPENLFVTRDDRVKILDFGLAKLTHPADGKAQSRLSTETPGTEPGVVLGTLGYMSPEQVRGQSADARSDIFALGAVLYEMLSGARAFRGGSAADTMSAILKEDPPDLSVTDKNVSPALERIVRHCLEKNAERRFQSARDLAFNLESLSALSTPSGVLAALPAPRKRPHLVTVLAALFVALGILGAGLLLGRRLGEISQPKYQEVTYKPGYLTSARFAPDGRTILYSAAWGGDPIQGFLKRPESPDAVPLGPPGAGVLAVSPSGEVALALDCKRSVGSVCGGTLARIPLAGGAPRELYEHIQQADWSPDGSALAVVSQVGNKSRLESPPGKVLYESTGYVSDPRFSPRGDAIAFFDHPIANNGMGSVAVVNLSGKKQALTALAEVAGGLAWSPSGKEIWFSARVGNDRYQAAIHAVTLSGRQRLVAGAPESLRLHDVFRDGRALVSEDGEEHRVFALAPGETRERDVSWLSWSAPQFLSRDGRTLLLLEQGGVGYQACLRRTDGSPVVQLGDGSPMSLSPDGKWALLRVFPQVGEAMPKEPYVLTPTGAGEPRRIGYEGIEEHRGAGFLADGEILFLGRRGSEREFRFYRGSLEGGKPSPAAPPAAGPWAVSPDGRRVLARSNGVPAVFSLDAGPDAPARPVPGATAGDSPVQWSDDGRSVYLRSSERSAKIFRVDLETGRRTLWKELIPSEPSAAIGRILLTPDGRSYAYGVSRSLSKLYLAEGLR